MVQVVPEKKCEDCNNILLTYSTKPKCLNCIKNYCCFSHKGRCNITFNCVESYAGNVCLAHFKTLQNKCFICKLPRPENDNTFMPSYMYYCYNHRHIYKDSVRQYALENLQNNLNTDVVDKIVDYACFPVTCRYPEEFHINSLKQSN